MPSIVPVGDGYGLELRVLDRLGNEVLIKEIENCATYDMELDIDLETFSFDGKTVRIIKRNYRTEVTVEVPQSVNRQPR